MLRRAVLLAAKVNTKKLVKANNVLEPTSKWSFDFCKQFTTMKVDTSLGLPVATETASSQVFERLPLNEHNLLNDADPTAHADIEGVMKKMKIPRNIWYGDVLKANNRMVDQLARACKESISVKKKEKKIDQCAEHFLQLCGFDDKPFSITAEGSDFAAFGMSCFSEADHYVVVTPDNDLVLIFEDKVGRLGPDGHIGQVIGEMLMMLSVNAQIQVPFTRKGKAIPPSPPSTKKPIFRSIYAVRFVDYHVSCFTMNPTEQQIYDVCLHGKICKPKLQLLTDTEKATRNKGFSLVDPKQRKHALRTMAAMRQAITKENK